MSLDALDASIWEQVERGELGEAFRLVWEAEGAPEQAADRQRTRAELQAYCGNEDAALALIADLEDPSGLCSMVRARVAASRGDWEPARAHALEAMESAGARSRAALLAARASIELNRPEEVSGLLDSIVAESPVQALAVAALRARLASDDPKGALATIAERAQAEDAARICAEAWADLSELHRARDETEEMRKAAVRAVELWDDMATSLPPPLRAGFWCDAKRQAMRKQGKSPKAGAGASSKSHLSPLLANLRRLASERDLSKLLSVITDGAVTLSGAERGFVLLVDEKGALEARTIRGAQNQLGEETAAFSRSIAETVLIDGDPVVTVDATHDARVQDYMSVHRLMLKSVACLPIESRGRIWGVLYLEHRSASGRFSGTDLALLRAYADQAAIAIETSNLFEHVEAQKRDLERANAALRDANEQLEQRLHGQTEALQRTRREIASLQASTSEGERWGLVGASEGMRRVYDLLDRLAGNEVPVVVTGESGTGKELVARAIHRGSVRSEGPYVSLNCGAIPEGILESELFGHEAGAFTGATHARDGVFQQAHGGTLFMDEIADMSPRMQLDLLRVLQERRVRPVGGSEEKDDRRPPHHRVEPSALRADRRRQAPRRPLLSTGRGRARLAATSRTTLRHTPALRSFPPAHCPRAWGAKKATEPRRLAAALCARLPRERSRARAPPRQRDSIRRLPIASKRRSLRSKPIAFRDLRARSWATTSPSRTPSATGCWPRSMRTGWNRAKAARALGMARRTFYRRLKEHGIELPSGKGGAD